MQTDLQIQEFSKISVEHQILFAPHSFLNLRHRCAAEIDSRVMCLSVVGRFIGYNINTNRTKANVCCMCWVNRLYIRCTKIIQNTSNAKNGRKTI